MKIIKQVWRMGFSPIPRTLPIPLLLLFAAALPALADGTINMANPSAGTGWTFADNIVTITANGNYTVTGSSTTNRIVVDKNVTATVTLQNASIHSASASPFALSSDTSGSDVTLILLGSNELVTTNVGSAGLQVGDSAKINIQGDGSLFAKGGGVNPVGGAGIGSGYGQTIGTIIVTSGTITATGSSIAAGIGGGSYGTGGKITIAGGTITATGGEYASGIGGGGNAAGGNITITGGTVTATAGRESAGIGGGQGGNGGNITITGGTIIATGGDYGAGIGGSWGGDAGNITVSGGTVYASSRTAAGIGGGMGVSGGAINITGGTIIADEIGYNGNSASTTTTISGANTVVLSQTIITTTFGGATVLTGDNVSVSNTITIGDTVADVTLNAALTIPSGATLVVPAGIVFDVNSKALTNNGLIREYGSIKNKGSLTGNQALGAIQAGWITIPNQTYTYTGDSIKPLVTVTNETLTLAHGVHYSVAYTNNINAGTATATVTDLGDYSIVSKTFTIAPKALAAGFIQDISAQAYTGDSIKPAVTVRDGDYTLVAGTDYAVSYTDNVNIGTATVTVTGMGNYTGSATTTFFITRRPVAADWIESIPAQAYTGDTIIPAVTVKDGSRILTPDTDYTITYSNNVNAGLGMVRVIGKGNYTGNAYGYFNILPRQIATEWLEDVPPQVWTGEAIEPAVTVRDGDGTLTPGTDYKVTYANNVNVGPEAWVSVTGVGNYTGTKSKMFSIVSPQTDTVPTPPPADTVPKAVTGVSFYNDSYIVEKGQSLQLFALFVPADAGNRNVSWATSNKAVATVSGNGKVTAVSAGEATITVTTEDGGYRDSCLIRVPGIVTTKDTVIYQKIIFYERDTLYRDTTVYRTDTLYTDTTVHRVDTLYRDTTLYRVDTLYRDTTVYRTDTLYNDTIIYVVNIVQVDSIDYNLVPDTVYVVTDITGAEHAVTENARVVRVGTVLRIEGLTPGKTFSIYTIKGEKYYSGTAQSDVFRLNNIPQGVYILYHNGQYSKFSY